MCGIAGLFDTRGKRDFDRALMKRMNDIQFHRGPDEGEDPLEHYLQVIADKTGSLIAASAQYGGMVAGASDEVRAVMQVFDQTLFHAVPRLYRSVESVISNGDAGRREPAVPAFLRFGSWVGGDRDGNPFVTAEVTRQTAAIQADHALRALATVGVQVIETVTLPPPEIGVGMAETRPNSAGFEPPIATLLRFRFASPVLKITRAFALVIVAPTDTLPRLIGPGAEGMETN